MKRKIAALLICLAMVAVSLAACNGDSADKSVSQGETKSSDPSNNGDKEPVNLTIYFQTHMGAQDAQDEVAAAMSEITREKMNATVTLVPIDGGSYKQALTLAFSGGEQVDLFNTCGLDSYAAVVNHGYALNLEEDNLLQTHGTGILDTIDQKYLDPCRVDGSIYGLPTMRDMAIGQFALAVAAQYLDGIGYEYTDDDIIYVKEGEIERILAELHETFPDKTVTKYGLLSQNILYDALGGDNFGVLLDPVNSLKVEDFFSSDLYYDYCKMFYNWNQAGYISQDAMASDAHVTTEVRAGTLMSYLCGTKPWCIGFTTADKTASMQLLNELYTNPELSRLICWGREDFEWVETDDGHMTYPDGIDADTSPYLHSVNWEMPNQFIAGVWEGDDLDIWEKTESFNDNALVSKALGFTFDNSALMNEYTAMVNVYNEYSKQLEMGFLNPDEGIPEMVERLKAAGLDKYIAEKQAQLDAWASENGIS